MPFFGCPDQARTVGEWALFHQENGTGLYRARRIFRERYDADDATEEDEQEEECHPRDVWANARVDRSWDFGNVRSDGGNEGCAG